MLTGVPRSFWGWNYVLSDEAGNDQARVKISWWSESGTIDLNTMTLSIVREGMTGPWQVQADGKIVATIIKPSAFSRAFQLRVDSTEYTLKPRGWGSSFSLYAEGRLLGCLERVGFFSRNMRVNLPDDLPLLVRALAAWVFLLMQRRASHQAAT